MTHSTGAINVILISKVHTTKTNSSPKFVENTLLHQKHSSVLSRMETLGHSWCCWTPMVRNEMMGAWVQQPIESHSFLIPFLASLAKLLKICHPISLLERGEARQPLAHTCWSMLYINHAYHPPSHTRITEHQLKSHDAQAVCNIQIHYKQLYANNLVTSKLWIEQYFVFPSASTIPRCIVLTHLLALIGSTDFNRT